MNENELAQIVLDTAFEIHTKTGPGLLESAYETILHQQLVKKGLAVECQVMVPIRYGDLIVPDAFRADLIIEGRLIVELKSVETMLPVHSKQLFTQLRLTGLKLGLLINFGEFYLKNGIERIANSL